MTWFDRKHRAKAARLFRQITGISWLLRSSADWYERAKNPLPTPVPTQSGWSLVVVTDGKSPHSLKLCTESFQREMANSPHEVIVVGPPAYREILLWGVPGGICRKKNIGVRMARYDKVVICHDYIVFQPGWKKGFDQFGDFTVATNVILDQAGQRHNDWLALDWPGLGWGLLPYDVEQTRYQYLSGAYFVVNRDFYLAHPLDERLRWGEKEDIEWSRRIRTQSTFRMNTASVVQYSRPKQPAAPLLTLHA